MLESEQSRLKRLRSFQYPRHVGWLFPFGYPRANRSGLILIEGIDSGANSIDHLKEQIPPSRQDMFQALTSTIFDQITQRIHRFYKGY